MAEDRVKVGIVGCGAISGIYFENMCKTHKDILDVVACADLMPERAQEKAKQYPGVKVLTVDQMMADPEIEIIVNLTVPKAHAPVSLQAVRAGKSAYAEKPITLTRDEAKELLKTAKANKVLVGNAPDTFLGGGIQACRKLLDDGAIGQPVAATAFMLCHGHESWHPDPEFYYEKGGGPMFDMGPYYLTALVSLLGPVRRVTGANRITFPTRTITSQKKNGKIIQVETPTHVTGLLDFASGAIGTIITTFDVWTHSGLPNIEIYGTEGTMKVPDPNSFGGGIRVWNLKDQNWRDIDPATVVSRSCDNGRGVGVADMARSLRAKRRKHRASGALAFHVLDIMIALHEASDKGKHVNLKSKVERPAPMPGGVD